MIALLFATRQEAAPLIEKLGMTPRDTSPFETYSMTQATLIISGMGPALATSACYYLNKTTSPSLVINAGVSGSLSSSILPIGDVAICDSVTSESSPPQAIMLQEPPAPCQSLWASLPHARLISVSRPLFGGPRRDALTPYADLVDMEGFSVATVCNELSLPCLLLKGTTDFAETGDRDRLHANLHRLAEHIATTLMTVLQ